MNNLDFNMFQEHIAQIQNVYQVLDSLESKKNLFYTIDDVIKITGWSKKTVQDLFNHPAFPCTNFGKQKLVLIPAFVSFFMERRDKNEQSHWEYKPTYFDGRTV